MSTLDTIVSSAEDSLLPDIKYSLNNKRGANFVHQRALTTFFPTTSGVYSPTTQRGLKFMLSDQGKGIWTLRQSASACVSGLPTVQILCC